MTVDQVASQAADQLRRQLGMRADAPIEARLAIDKATGELELHFHIRDEDVPKDADTSALTVHAVGHA